LYESFSLKICSPVVCAGKGFSQASVVQLDCYAYTSRTQAKEKNGNVCGFIKEHQELLFVVMKDTGVDK
jgi:hypothetical protein